MKRKKKHKKKKVDANMRRRMDELEGIYGVDARTLAGIETGGRQNAPMATGGKGDGKASGYDDMSLRSTQNTMRQTHMKSNLGESQQFGFG